ncbi:MAG: enoyl-CoA hydratase/isomerase family protein [Acidobacteriaceae bacterium]|nr:enoyl-CoA hydratase/isomerase family protein [Acidobacteriaceae bacterium]MBV9501260.1 enoyl-CoA hydratase/isomerase family protein [Acidobacteriaceae bacterium]
MHLHVSNTQRVLQLTLCRPEKRNALDAEMCGSIVEAVRDAQDRDEVGSILIAAHGPVFCSGMDLDEAVGPKAEELERVHEALFTLGSESLKPLVVCANGAALGGGVGLVAQGHVVVAAENAVFALTEIRVGLWPFLVYRSVEAALGPRRTLELSLTGRTFHAHQGLHWGLVHQVCPLPEVSDRARAVARELAKSSPLAIAHGMQYVRDSRGKSLEDAGKLAASLRGELMNSDDFREGVAAFKQKREALWPSMKVQAGNGNSAR